jgi:hypothetical protein
MKKLAKTPAEYSKQFKQMPADFLLGVMNGSDITDVLLNEDGTFVKITRPPTFREKMDAAKTVIAYLHPKLTSVVIEDKSSLEVVDDVELFKRAKELLAEMPRK